MNRYTAAALTIAFVGLISWLASPTQAPEAPAPSEEDAARLEGIRQIEAGTLTTPLVREQAGDGAVTLTFLVRRSGDSVPRVVSDVTGWGERADGGFDFGVGAMTRVGQTDWYALETAIAPDARIEYLIAHGTSDYRLDAYNPRRVQRVGGPASEAVGPGYAPPQELQDPPTNPAGAITEAVIPSRAIGSPRRVIVYTPPGYRPGRRYPLAVFHDGGLMVNTGQAPRVVDWLIAHQVIPPIVAVFVDPQSRAVDYRRGAPMRAFVTGELLPWIAQRYSVTSDSDARAIIGFSAGARGALDAAASSEQFGRLGLLIPALDAADIDAIPPAGRHRLRVSIVAGTYDASNLPAARSAQGVLADRGHVVDLTEVPEGHSTNTWRNHLRDVLVSLFGGV
ncbi:MAG: alpha/beta hydrolase-fold protein [Acidobacteria bacterium]|nr:alpha/beta hydrolase-fold protein [Acidobacteriota bacterium]